MELERVVRVLEEREEGLKIIKGVRFEFCVFFLCLVSKHKF